MIQALIHHSRFRFIERHIPGNGPTPLFIDPLVEGAPLPGAPPDNIIAARCRSKSPKGFVRPSYG